jgi:hypothetical protein
MGTSVDFFPLSDPGTLSTLVVGYHRDRYLPHFAERFIELTKEVLDRSSGLPG